MQRGGGGKVERGAVVNKRRYSVCVCVCVCVCVRERELVTGYSLCV